MRHSWLPAQRPSELHTVRACRRCGLVLVTRHDGGPGAIPWFEFYYPESGLLYRGRGTPRCRPIEAGGGSGLTPACEPVEAGGVA
jgi:hypothetical protein